MSGSVNHQIAEHSSVALLHKRDINNTLGWFSKTSRYIPRPNNVIKPLINGESAFAALQNALEKARHSIDIITWGFDPSMRLSPPGGPRLGELLRQKANSGAAVRILVWKDALSNSVENNIVGDGLGGSGGGSAGLGSGIGSTSARDARSGGKTPYAKPMSGTGSAGIKTGDPDARAFNRDWFKQLLPKNLSFRTRDMSWYAKESVLQMYRLKIEASLPQHLAYSVSATHHQKMVLVDYEYTDTATGFVMGHNLLRNYWDRDAHEYDDPLRLGFAPWQDLSMQVWGEVLWCLNDTFTSAWKSSQPLLGRDQPIPDSRSAIIVPQFFAGSAAKRGSTCMAQICRTQPQESDWSILELYRTVLPNARKYIYIENQYFRQPELAKLLRQTYRKLKAGGWKQELYVFIVTNVPEKAGRITTYETLNALGKGNQMPVIHKKRAGDQDNSEDAQLIRKRDLEGMNIHVCTLCTSGTQAQKLLRPPQTVYRDIYVHSKLLLIDDVFFTLGSANFNTRSMVIDSELNIAAPSPQITKELREKLWGLHTKRQPSDDPATEFETWRRLMSKNLKNRNDGVPLEGSLIEFYDDSSSIWKVD